MVGFSRFFARQPLHAWRVIYARFIPSTAFLQLLTVAPVGSFFMIYINQHTDYPMPNLRQECEIYPWEKVLGIITN